MSDSVRPHRRQPTRLPHPRDSPGKNTGVGCHFLLQCMKVKSESEVTQSCPTLCLFSHHSHKDSVGTVTDPKAEELLIGSRKFIPVTKKAFNDEKCHLRRNEILTVLLKSSSHTALCFGPKVS